MDAVILALVGAALAADPADRRSETRLSAVAVARTENRLFTGEAVEVGVFHQFPAPLVLGVSVVAGVENEESWDLDGSVGFTVAQRHSPWIDIRPRFGYTVRVGRVDATPMLFLSTYEERYDNWVPFLSADIRWWWSPHWSVQGSVGPRRLVEADGGLCDVGLGVAWRGRLPDLTE